MSPSAVPAAVLFWAVLASGQINVRKVDGWKTLTTKPIDQPIHLAVQSDSFTMSETTPFGISTTSQTVPNCAALRRSYPRGRP